MNKSPLNMDPFADLQRAIEETSMTENAANLRTVSADFHTEAPKSTSWSVRDYLKNEKLRQECRAKRLRVASLQAQEQGVSFAQRPA